MAESSFVSFDQFEHPRLDTLRELNVDSLNATCRSCDFRYWCSGDCRGETYQTTGDLRSVHPDCADLQAGFTSVLWMAMSNPEMYFDKSNAFYRRTGRRDAISDALDTGNCVRDVWQS